MNTISKSLLEIARQNTAVFQKNPHVNAIMVTSQTRKLFTMELCKQVLSFALSFLRRNHETNRIFLIGPAFFSASARR